MDSLKTGDIFLTHNTDEVGNDNPGYYNHTSILSKDFWVVEAQEKAGVIGVPFHFFYDRYPEILVLRNNNSTIANRTGSLAIEMLGRPYRSVISYRPRWKAIDGDNCVSLVRRIYYLVVGIDYKWRKPDDFLGTKFLKPIFEKKDYENWKKPDTWYAGAIFEPPT